MQLQDIRIIPADMLPGALPHRKLPEDAKDVPRQLVRRKWRRRLTIVAVLVLAVWMFHARLLRGIAGGLIVEDPRGPAPAVLILDGDRQFDSAAELSRAGAATILVYRCRPDRLARMGIMPRGDETARRELLQRGVSDQDVEILVGESATRSRIAAALGQWLADHPDQTVNVLCDRFTSRTWKIVLQRAVAPALAANIQIVPLSNRQFDETNWWRSKPGTMAFVNSYIRLGFHYWRSGDEVDVVERSPADFRAAFAGDPGG
jgi:hypothetical protein